MNKERKRELDDEHNDDSEEPDDMRAYGDSLQDWI